jgi:hypothetical protein
MTELTWRWLSSHEKGDSDKCEDAIVSWASDLLRERMSSESPGDLNLLTRNLAHFHQRIIELLAGIRGAIQLDAMF